MRLIACLCLAFAFPGPFAAQDRPFASFDLAGPAVLNDPHDLAVGPDGRVYVADKLGNRIAVLDPETLELVETIGDGLMPQVRDVSFGPDGQAAVAVSGLGTVLGFRNARGRARTGGGPRGAGFGGRADAFERADLCDGERDRRPDRL